MTEACIILIAALAAIVITMFVVVRYVTDFSYSVMPHIEELFESVAHHADRAHREQQKTPEIAIAEKVIAKAEDKIIEMAIRNKGIIEPDESAPED